ncbi:MAG: hypothetical protein IJ456_08270 [Bacteroides sp.]|nr:hypothetical protein [Bacteroides sp.]
MGKLVGLIAAMTCVECGIRMEQVDTKAIWEGYRLAFKSPPCEGGGKGEGIPHTTDPIWDEYWDWSPMAYGA